jgi:DNA-binding HxlR family transcriptional regulator
MATTNSCWFPASPAVQALAGRTLAVLTELANGGRRYQDALDGISHKVLTNTLRRPSATVW